MNFEMTPEPSRVPVGPHAVFVVLIRGPLVKSREGVPFLCPYFHFGLHRPSRAVFQAKSENSFGYLEPCPLRFFPLM